MPPVEVQGFRDITSYLQFRIVQQGVLGGRTDTIEFSESDGEGLKINPRLDKAPGLRIQGQGFHAPRRKRAIYSIGGFLQAKPKRVISV